VRGARFGKAFATYADYASNKLVEFGLDREVVTSVPYFKNSYQSTRASFQALREWLENSPAGIQAVNVYTVGVHARKSFILCRKTLGAGMAVGVISAPPKNYAPKRWWLSKIGIRLVFKNFVGYLYAMLV